MVRLVILGVEAFRQQLKGRIEALADGEDTIVLRRSKFVGALISADEYREYRQLKGDPTEL
jgi:PHD/YefM family antitoxin component YafN of YafNO toxin-antitoxin module